MRASPDLPLITAEELERVSPPDKSTELVRGRLIVREPPGTEHGRIQANLMFVLMSFVRANKSGIVLGQDTGFKIASDPDTVRGPDLSFLRQDLAKDIPKHGFAALAPDLIVEILSPGNRAGEMLARIGDFLNAGTRLVWVVDPRRGEARVHRPDGSLTMIAADGSLDGEDVLPGFRCTLAEVFG